MVRIKIDREKCISCGTCVAMMPEVFELDDEMKSRVKNSDATLKTSKEKLQEAAEACPVGAIEVIEDEN